MSFGKMEFTPTPLPFFQNKKIKNKLIKSLNNKRKIRINFFKNTLRPRCTLASLGTHNSFYEVHIKALRSPIFFFAFFFIKISKDKKATKNIS
jgi:hypothetical protein